MRIRPIAVAIVGSLHCLTAVSARAQVTGVSVAPPSPLVGQPATVTVSGQNPCGTLLIDFGDGAAQLYSPPGLPFTTPHTWTAEGTKNIIADGYGACTGRATLAITVPRATPAPKVPRATPAPKVPRLGGILQLCEQVDCGTRPKMIRFPVVSTLLGFNTPGGYLAIAGKDFGISLGSVVASLKTWSGGTIERRLEAVEWRNTMIGVQWPTDLSGLRQQTATLVVTTVDGVRSAPRSFTFSPALDIKTLTRSEVAVVSCGSDGNYDSCNGVQDESPPQYFAIPRAVADGATILGVHFNSWGAIGNDTGSDGYRIALQRDWTLESMEWRVSAEPGQGFVRKPAGFTKGASWTPSIDWEVTPNDQVVYAVVLTISGPVGVPYK